MNDRQFKKLLHLLLYAQSRFSLPFPPKNKEEQAFYMELAGRYCAPHLQVERGQVDWPDSPLWVELCDRFPNEWRGFNLGRKYNFSQLIKFIAKVEGDTAECGVYFGATSWLILKLAAHNPDNSLRTHYMFDSFAGFSDPGPQDKNFWKKGEMAASLDVVKKNLEQFSNQCVYMKGWIPERFPEVEDKKFALVHVDVDLYAPTLACLEFFYPRLVKGGILICDDYGSAKCPGATQAVTEFLESKPEKMVGLSTSSGYFIKGIEM